MNVPLRADAALGASAPAASSVAPASSASSVGPASPVGLDANVGYVEQSWTNVRLRADAALGASTPSADRASPDDRPAPPRIDARLSADLDDARALVLAASRRSMSEHRRAEAQRLLLAWSQKGGARRQAQLAAWDGTLAYTEGRVDEALGLMREAIRVLPAASRSALNARAMLAAALMDTGRLAEAREVAAALLAEAERSRAPIFEARAWSILRHATLRSGEHVAPRPDLIAIARDHLDGNAAASLLGSESCIAWRAGALDLAQRSMLDAAQVYERFALRGGAAFFDAVGAAIGAPVDPARLRAIAPILPRLPVGLRAQVAALRARAGAPWEQVAPLVTAEEVAGLRGLPMLELLWPHEIEAMLQDCHRASERIPDDPW